MLCGPCSGAEPIATASLSPLACSRCGGSSLAKTRSTNALRWSSASSASSHLLLCHACRDRSLGQLPESQLTQLRAQRVDIRPAMRYSARARRRLRYVESLQPAELGRSSSVAQPQRRHGGLRVPSLGQAEAAPGPRRRHRGGGGWARAPRVIGLLTADAAASLHSCPRLRHFLDDD